MQESLFLSKISPCFFYPCNFIILYLNTKLYLFLGFTPWALKKVRESCLRWERKEKVIGWQFQLLKKSRSWCLWILLNERSVIDVFLNFYLFKKIDWSLRIFFSSKKVRKNTKLVSNSCKRVYFFFDKVMDIFLG